MQAMHPEQTRHKVTFVEIFALTRNTKTIILFTQVVPHPPETSGETRIQASQRRYSKWQGTPLDNHEGVKVEQQDPRPNGKMRKGRLLPSQCHQASASKLQQSCVRASV